MLPLSHPKSAFHVSGNLQTVSHPGAPGNLCLSLSRSHAALAAWFSGSLSLSDMTVGKVSHFYAISGTERSLGQRDTFLSAGDSQYPHSVAGRLSGFWYVLGASLRLTPWLHSQKWKIFDLVKGLASGHGINLDVHQQMNG